MSQNNQEKKPKKVPSPRMIVKCSIKLKDFPLEPNTIRGAEIGFGADRPHRPSSIISSFVGAIVSLGMQDGVYTPDYMVSEIDRAIELISKLKVGGAKWSKEEGQSSGYEDGQPCTHPGCKSHVSHPCEVCGRIAAHGRRVEPSQTDQKLENEAV